MNAYIGAIDFYKDWDKADHRTRALAYANAMGQLAQYRGLEASVFYMPRSMTALPTDQTFANQLRRSDPGEGFARRSSQRGSHHP